MRYPRTHKIIVKPKPLNMKPKVNIIKEDELYKVVIKIGVQEFKLAYEASIKSNADWYASMVRQALNGIEIETKNANQLASKLIAIASQENCDGETFDEMIEAAHCINQLEAENTRLKEIKPQYETESI